jgi:deoxycytidine triphosphate deaminase
MSFWSTQVILKRQSTDCLINPWETDVEKLKEKLKEGHYELSLGGEHFVTDSKLEYETKPEKDKLIVIQPGQFSLLISHESVNIPQNVLAFISIKSCKKLEGLVNISGFHVDPGYHGKLIFAVFNAGKKEIKLVVGKPLFVIWFSSLATDSDCDVDKYPRIKSGYDSLPQEYKEYYNGHFPVTLKLESDIKQLGDRLDWIQKMADVSRNVRISVILFIGGLLVAVIGGALGSILANVFEVGYNAHESSRDQADHYQSSFQSSQHRPVGNNNSDAADHHGITTDTRTIQSQPAIKQDQQGVSKETKGTSNHQ